MKRKISCLLLGEQYRYIVQKKAHWWNRWHYILDGKYPRLFTLAELIGLHLISLEELEKNFKADDDRAVVIL